MTRAEFDQLVAAIENCQAEMPHTLPVTRDIWDAYWSEFAQVGPRHRNVARWIHDYGWCIAPAVTRAYLAQEMH